jgi:hypothetical protein
MGCDYYTREKIIVITKDKKYELNNILTRCWGDMPKKDTESYIIYENGKWNECEEKEDIIEYCEEYGIEALKIIKRIHMWERY